MLQKPVEEQSSLNDEILQKERDLDLLVRELDDKVRFGQKGTERPSSGGGRFAGLQERPPSQAGTYEEPTRGGEFRERPRSRGTGDAWSRPMDDRRAYQGGRGRGFLSSRDMDSYILLVNFAVREGAKKLSSIGTCKHFGGRNVFVQFFLNTIVTRTQPPLLPQK
ncbi:hypothetical protein M9H77_10219 [Catharanthus roseus]|uniref:Uncharacterized protein n=1 Tax=Catharanthus roseus TaxID=4058 RepID=A0ACC0C316_CATRO|nr:hypothetical protein M9H77_10219 [Catharanthus roseus]